MSKLKPMEAERSAWTLARRRRELEKEAILLFLVSGAKVTEEIRKHLWCEYYLVGDLLRELRAEGKIQSARAPTQRANTQKKWRLTPTTAVTGGVDSIHRPDGSKTD